MAEIEIMSDSDYMEAGTVRINIHNSQHNGKVWQHTHGFYEFVYVDQGFSLHSYNGKTSVLTSGDLFAIFPGDVHSYNSAYQTRIYNVLFYLEDLPGVREELLTLPGIAWNRENRGDHLPIIRVGLAERMELVSLLERMQAERKNKAIGWELNLKGLLINFLIMYSRLISAAAENPVKEESDHRGYCGYIYSVLRFVEENYTRDISAGDIAAAAGLSADYLTRQFKSVMSMTPAEYVRKFRIAKSMDLLKTTDMSIADIAAATGFGDLSLYSRVFKQNIGVSPAAFRKE
ncbi:MAG: helix-turn-helix domain-containing protein [Clostridia bacterium]|nr:helix-turn-helix domain-containing protein [Clostridia bacterium]MBQ2708937.1 helix-turn-helix domain-containing protein [Clostridia bacterium]